MLVLPGECDDAWIGGGVTTRMELVCLIYYLLRRYVTTRMDLDGACLSDILPLEVSRRYVTTRMDLDGPAYRCWSSSILYLSTYLSWRPRGDSEMYVKSNPN